MPASLPPLPLPISPQVDIVRARTKDEEYVHQLYTRLYNTLVHFVPNARLANPSFTAAIHKALYFFYYVFTARTLLPFCQSPGATPAVAATPGEEYGSSLRVRVDARSGSIRPLGILY